VRALGLTVAVVLGVGCANAGSAVANAAINTAIAGGVSAYRRSNGECYTPCTPGTKCNEKTGTCDPLPCRGECRPNERCEQTYTGEHCVPDVELEIRGTPSTGAAGTSAPVKPPSLLPDAGAPAPARPRDAPTLEAP
jgi:hypothetical protein